MRAIIEASGIELDNWSAWRRCRGSFNPRARKPSHSAVFQL